MRNAFADCLNLWVTTPPYCDFPSKTIGCGLEPAFNHGRFKVWYDNNKGNFKMRFGHKIKEFYTYIPPYTKLEPHETEGNMYTNFNCGHMAAHYCAGKLKADEVHMYGFDSLFDMNLRSVTDLYLNSDRSNANNFRLAENWRPIWQGIFNEFSETKFVIYHKHDNIKFAVGSNVVIDTTRKTK